MHIKKSWVQLPRNFKKKVHELPRSGGLQRTDNPLLYNLNPTSIWLLQPRDAVGTWIFLFIPKPKTPNSWTKSPKVLLSCHIAVIFFDHHDIPQRSNQQVPPTTILQKRAYVSVDHSDSSQYLLFFVKPPTRSPPLQYHKKIGIVNRANRHDLSEL